MDDLRNAQRSLVHASEDVLAAQKEQWNGAVSNFVRLVDTDPALSVATRDLTAAEFDGEQWFGSIATGPKTAQGTPHEVRFPPTLKSRAALGLQVLRAVDRGDLDWYSLPFMLYGAIGDYPTRLRRIHHDFVAPLVKYLEGPIMDQLERAHLELRRPLVVGRDYFHNAGVMTQNALAMGGSTAAVGDGDSTRAQIAERFRQWSLSLPGVDEAERPSARAALELLARVLEVDDDRPPATRLEVAHAVQAVAQASPTLRDNLRQIAIGASANALGTMIPAAIEFVLGIPPGASTPAL